MLQEPAALALLRDRGSKGCVVLGDPGYYGRFGFVAVSYQPAFEGR